MSGSGKRKRADDDGAEDGASDCQPQPESPSAQSYNSTETLDLFTGLPLSMVMQMEQQQHVDSDQQEDNKAQESQEANNGNYELSSLFDIDADVDDTRDSNQVPEPRPFAQSQENAGGSAAEPKSQPEEPLVESSPATDGGGNKSSFIMQHGLQPPPVDPNSWEDFPVRAWRDAVIGIMKEVGLDSATWARPLKLSTTCSGLGSAAIALHEMGVPFNELWACDVKDICWSVAERAGVIPEHYFDTAEDARSRLGFCKKHQTICYAEDSISDVYIAGFPCAPFSMQRNGRWRPNGWQSHPEVKVMTSVIGTIREQTPRVGILENVTGFVKNSRTNARMGGHVMTL